MGEMSNIDKAVDWRIECRIHRKAGWPEPTFEEFMERGRIHTPIRDTKTGRVFDRSELKPTQLYERGPDGDQYRYQPIIKEQP